MTDPSPSDPIAAQVRAQRLRTTALFAIRDANRAVVERGWAHPAYAAGRVALDDVLASLARAKWSLGQADGTYLTFAPPASDRMAAIASAEAGFREAAAACERIRADAEAGRATARPGRTTLTRHHEIQFAGGTPLVPSVCPVVVLKGSNRDMGRQYAQQLVDIFGTWILERQAALEIGDAERAEIGRWSEPLAEHMPGILEFAAGMAEGATRAGVPLTREQAVAIWTGIRPPAKESRPMSFAQTDGHDARITAAYLGVAAPASPAETDLCSGICAWGRGTRDGSLVAGSSTDHDVSFQATIVAFPDDGHAYVYTPFGANGAIPVLGTFQFAGHPGMNDAGLAYVHHGGANTGEPVEQWGYGVRRGPATLHMLQHCATAEQARDAHRPLPVGDAGISLGTVGGLFADARYGFSLECRTGAPRIDRPILREHSFDAYGDAYDFLYANNNAMAPESGHLNVPPPGGYRFSIAGGWFTLDWAEINAEPGPKAFRRVNTRNSEGRNRYAYRMMMAGYGRVDVDYMTMVYRCSGTMPVGTHDEVRRRWEAGEPWNSSVAHRGNAFTAVMNPRADGDGVYLGCVGPANRAVQPRGPEHGYHYFDETNAFSELRLRRDPEGVLTAAIDRARQDLDRAHALRAAAGPSHPGSGFFAAWIDEGRAALERAREFDASAGRDGRDARLAALSRALRAATRAQVRARQVADAVEPPPTGPERLAR